MKLLIAGAGGHGRVVADVAMCTGNFSEIAFVDDKITGSVPEGWGVVGTMNDLDRLRARFDCFIAAIGKADLRLHYLAAAAACGYRLETIVHPSAVVSKFADIETGTVVVGGAVINVGCKVARGCIINTGATVDHDCVLGEGVHICPGAHLAGNVRIGSRSWFGIGAVAKQGVSIGADVTVGAGAAVIKSIPDGATVVGNPARPLVRKL